MVVLESCPQIRISMILNVLLVTVEGECLKAFFGFLLC